MSDIRLLVVAADPLTRAGLTTLLSEREGIAIVGQTAGDDNLSELLPIYRPEIILWDLGWEALEAPSAFEELPAPVVAILPGDELAVDVWMAGAAAILLRSSSPDQLHATVLAVAHGLRVLDPAFLDQLLPPDVPRQAPFEGELTPREHEVLQLLTEGLTNRAIAQELDVSEHTVKFHVNAIMSKLDAQSRTEAVVKASRQGIILL